jgi:hypothetical protein
VKTVNPLLMSVVLMNVVEPTKKIDQYKIGIEKGIKIGRETERLIEKREFGKKVQTWI